MCVCVCVLYAHICVCVCSCMCAYMWCGHVDVCAVCKHVARTHVCVCTHGTCVHTCCVCMSTRVYVCSAGMREHACMCVQRNACTCGVYMCVHVWLCRCTRGEGPRRTTDQRALRFPVLQLLICFPIPVLAPTSPSVPLSVANSTVL